MCSCEALKAWVASTKGEYDEVLRSDLMLAMYCAVPLPSQPHDGDDDNDNHCYLDYHHYY